MKKSFLLFSLFTFSFLYLKAQQQPSYTQYTLNRFGLNPAVAGIQPCSETILGNRRQWVGFEGAPSLLFASFNTRINKDDKYPKNFHGFGFQAYSNEEGFYQTTSIKLAYAYHIKLSKNYRASVGIFAGFQRGSFNIQEVNISNRGLDPAINKEEANTLIYPEISPGGFIYNRNFYAGLSMLQLFPARTGNFRTKENRLTAHYFLSAGYRLRTRTLHYIPSFLLSFSPFISPTMDLTLTADYKNRISFALGSKYLNSGYATLQLKVLSNIFLGYSYEYALNEINNVAPTTHEIILRFANCSTNSRKKRMVCPAYE